MVVRGVGGSGGGLADSEPLSVLLGIGLPPGRERLVVAVDLGLLPGRP